MSILPLFWKKYFFSIFFAEKTKQIQKTCFIKKKARFFLMKQVLFRSLFRYIQGGSPWLFHNLTLIFWPIVGNNQTSTTSTGFFFSTYFDRDTAFLMQAFSVKICFWQKKQSHDMRKTKLKITIFVTYDQLAAHSRSYTNTTDCNTGMCAHCAQKMGLWHSFRIAKWKCSACKEKTQPL